VKYFLDKNRTGVMMKANWKNDSITLVVSTNRGALDLERPLLLNKRGQTGAGGLTTAP